MEIKDMDSILSQVLDASQGVQKISTITPDFSHANIGAGNLDSTISRQWASRPEDERWTSHDDLCAHLAEIKANTEHLAVGLRDIMPTLDGGELKFKIAGQSKLVVPTNHAFGQLANKDMYGLPQKWIASCPPELANASIEHGRSLSVDRPVKLNIQHRDGQDDLVRAVTGPDYGYIADSDLANVVRDVLGDRWVVPVAFQKADASFNPVVARNPTKEQTTLYYGDRNMTLFFVDHTTVIEVCGRRFQRGFYVVNSEVCESALKVCTFLLDFVCMNRNIWGQTAFEVYSRKHTKYAPQDFLSKVAPALRSFADGSTIGVESAIRAAMAAPVKTEQAPGLLKSLFDMGIKDSADVLQAVLDEEGHEMRSFWDMFQGVTAVARGLPNADTRLAVETRAGALMNKFDN